MKKSSREHLSKNMDIYKFVPLIFINFESCAQVICSPKLALNQKTLPASFDKQIVSLTIL